MKTRAISVRVLSILLAMVLVLGMIPVFAMAADTKVVYFDNTEGWSKVKVYYWGVAGAPSWPGYDMQLVDGSIYSIEVPADTVNIIFNNGSGTQTSDLKIPTDGNLYTCSTGEWGTYDASGACEHVWNDGEVTTAPTCVAAGEIVYTCTKCAATYNGTVAALGHSFADGNCSVCGVAESLVIYFQNTNGWETVNAYFWCDAGNLSSWPGNAMELVAGDIYTITLPGDAQYIIFNDGTSQTGDLTIPADKNLYNGTDWDVFSGNACAHEWGDGQVVSAPTCTEKGQISYACALCGETKTAEVAANGHSFTDAVCSVCGAEEVYYIASNVNNWNNCDEAYKMALVDGKYVLSMDITAGATYFKVTDGTWDNAWPEADYLVNAAEDCTITITFDSATKEIVVTGFETAAVQYYIHGWINDADYDGSDYLFVDGKVTVNFASTSYVYVCTDGGIQYKAETFIDGTSGTLYVASETVFEKMLVPAGEITFTLVVNDDGSLTLSYEVTGEACEHYSHNTDGICDDCDAIVPHTFENGVCTVCGAEEPVVADPNFYVAGSFNDWNAADEACKMTLQDGVYVLNMDATNGKTEFKITDGTWDNNWPESNYVIYCGQPSSIIITFNPETEEITVDGVIECAHESHLADGICSDCGDKVAHSYDAEGFCTVCGTELQYYIHGYINGADYYENGLYFTDGRALVYLDSDSYIYLVDSDGNCYMTETFVEDKVGTFVKGGTEKMFIPGNEQVIIDLTVNEDGSLTLNAMYGSSFAKPTLTLDYPSLSFEDEILYNVYYTIDDTSYVVEMGLITFTERLVDGTIDDAEDVIPGYVNSGSTYMVQSNGIPAKNLSDAVYFKVYAKLDDGSYVYTDVAGYHAVAYARTVLNSTAADKAKALVVAMLNYGAAAQEYFGYKTDALMNASLTAEQQALVSAYDSSMVQDVVKADASKVGSFVMNGGYSNIFPTVSFEGAFAINFYFTPNKAVDDGLTFYYWDAKTYNSVDVLTAENATGVLPMAQDGANWGAAVSGIAAKAIDETVYVAAVYTSNGVEYPTSIVAYSLGNYCKTLATNGSAFGAATAVYGYYAKAYFA